MFLSSIPLTIEHIKLLGLHCDKDDLNGLNSYNKFLASFPFYAAGE